MKDKMNDRLRQLQDTDSIERRLRKLLEQNLLELSAQIEAQLNGEAITEGKIITDLVLKAQEISSDMIPSYLPVIHQSLCKSVAGMIVENNKSLLDLLLSEKKASKRTLLWQSLRRILHL